jgi:hypothetical protein
VDEIPRIAAEAREGCAEGLAPLVHCEVDGALCRRDPVSGEAATAALCQSLRPLIGFVHLSDARIREERVTLDLPFRIPGGEPFAQAGPRNEAQARHDLAVLLGTVLGVNRLAGADADGRLAGAHPSGAGTLAPGAYAPCSTRAAPWTWGSSRSCRAS